MNSERGVTLVEMMTVIMIVAILTALAIPSYRNVTTVNRIASEVNALLGDFQYARSEALREGQSVVVCPVADPAPSPLACATSQTWQTGWIVFADVNGTGNYSAGDILLREQQLFSGNASSDTVTASAGVVALTFNRQGFSGLPAQAQFKFQNARSETQFTRCIDVSVIGIVGLAPVASGICS